MGNQNCSLSSDSPSQLRKKAVKQCEAKRDIISQNQGQIPAQHEENKKLKNFLDEKFKENKSASGKIEFQIKEKRRFGQENLVFQKQLSVIKLEESQIDNTMEKSDIILQKTDSLFFQTTENLANQKYSSLNLHRSRNSQLQNSCKFRSSFASYGSHYKKLKIKQSNFVKIRNKNFQVSYELLDKIGQGATGHVFKARCRKTNQIRAVKILKTKILKKLNQTQKLHSQLNILKSLDHPNIIKVFDVYFTEEFYYVVTEYCSGGNLLEYLLKNSTIDQKLIKIVIRQLLGALSYLHSQSIVHRDIKLENLVFDVNPAQCSSVNDIQIKLIDFGLAMVAKFKSINKDMPCSGTPLYMAPQILKGSYSDKCDIWSCGVIMHFLLFKDFPFASVDVSNLYLKISHEQLDFTKPYWKNVSSQARQLLVNMLQKNPLRRYTANQALNSSWLEEVYNQSGKTEKDLVFRKLRQYKKQNNFITLIESYLVFLRSSDKEQKDLVTLFHKIDRNNNGVIDLNELEQIYVQKSDEEVLQLKQLFTTIDKNNSGKIQICEFLTFLSDRSKIFTQKNLEDAFDFLDQNKSGYIEKKQLKKALQGCEQEEYKVLWKDMDMDEDSRISKQEFMQYVLRTEGLKVL